MAVGPTADEELSGNPRLRQSFSAAAGIVGAATAAGYGLVGALLARLTVSPVVVGSTLMLSVLGGIVGLFLAGRENAAVRLGATSRRYVLLTPGAMLCLGSVGGVGRGTDAAWGGVLAGALVLFSGWILASMARTRYVLAVRARSETYSQWTMRVPQTVKRRRYLVSLCAFLLGFVVFVAGYVFEQTFPVAVFGGIGGGIIGSAHQTLTLHAHEDGLEIERPLNRTLLAWSQFEGYERTEEELRLRRSWRPDLHCAVTEIDDIEAVTETLNRHLEEC